MEKIMLVELSEKKDKFVCGLEFNREECTSGLKRENKEKFIDELKCYRE